jgi:K+-sensing histidine kinase KdpD
VARRSGGDLLAVHVLSSDGLTGASPSALRTQPELVQSLGGTHHEAVGDDVAAALLDFARSVTATQLVIGTSRREFGGALCVRGVEVDGHRVLRAQAPAAPNAIAAIPLGRQNATDVRPHAHSEWSEATRGATCSATCC